MEIPGTVSAAIPRKWRYRIICLYRGYRSKGGRSESDLPLTCEYLFIRSQALIQFVARQPSDSSLHIVPHRASL
jgi:hypothetical protein